MDTLQPNESSEAFGKLPHTSEPFGNIPKASERKEDHTLTVRIAARKFEDAGVPRTERSITNWCKPDANGVSRLDCYLDPNEGKYYITPQSIERAIEEEKSKSNFAELPHTSEPFGNVQNPSEAFRKVPHASESPSSEQPTNEQKENLPPNLAQELEELRIEKKVWERERKFYDTWFATVEKERANVLPKIEELSKSAGYFEAKSTYLEQENQELKAISIPIRRQFISQKPPSEEENSENTVRGDTADVEQASTHN